MFSPLNILVVAAIWILKGSSLPKIYHFYFIIYSHGQITCTVYMAHSHGQITGTV